MKWCVVVSRVRDGAVTRSIVFQDADHERCDAYAEELWSDRLGDGDTVRVCPVSDAFKPIEN